MKQGLFGGPHRSTDLQVGQADPTPSLFGLNCGGLSLTVDWRSSKSVSSRMIVICSDG